MAGFGVNHLPLGLDRRGVSTLGRFVAESAQCSGADRFNSPLFPLLLSPGRKVDCKMLDYLRAGSITLDCICSCCQLKSKASPSIIPRTTFSDSKNRREQCPSANDDKPRVRNGPSSLTTAVDSKASDLPDEQGVYINVGRGWKAIDPEVINMRTASVLGHAMSHGIAKAKLKGDIAGVRSTLQSASPVEILLKCAEGTAGSEYQILKMEVKGDRRELGVATSATTASAGEIPPCQHS